MLTKILFLLQWLIVCIASPLSTQNADALIKTIHKFSNITWVENIAVRQNGKILVTLINTPQIWQIDPTEQTADLVHEFPHAISAMGIAEYKPEVFAINIGNFSLTTATAATGSWSTWSLDLSRRGKKASVRKIVDIPSAGFLNGITAVPTAPGILLAVDSGNGLVYRIDTVKNTWSIFLDDPTLKPNLTAAVKLGVNGVHVRNDHLYFDNTFQSPLLARVPYHPKTATKAGPVEVILESATFPLNEGYGQADDFTFDHKGNIWLASASSSVVKLDLRKKTQTLIVGGPDDATVVGSTSAAFGRTMRGRDVLYITTNGGISDPSVAGLTGGKVLALDTSKL